ncbi:MAG TPA: hypothetical protein PKH51_07450, partial [Candidatus Sumerlaeota bacterium]|nr:hypothetical protein [Candidatus Sumerlaeota bacterium]HNM46839.1 hypothetical protein [Candidatus Sumerlaeota bacterium]
MKILCAEYAVAQIVNGMNIGSAKGARGQRQSHGAVFACSDEKSKNGLPVNTPLKNANDWQTAW